MIQSIISERPLWPGSLGTKFPSSGAKGKSIHPETNGGNISFHPLHWQWLCTLGMYAGMCFQGSNRQRVGD